jgi:hypothetical protein
MPDALQPPPFLLFNRVFSRRHARVMRAACTPALLYRSTAALGFLRVARSGPTKTPALRRFFNRVSEPAPAVPVPGISMWSVGKQLIIKPFIYASLYSASTAALTLVLLSAPQLAAAPPLAQAALILANSAAAFAVGSAHGSFNGVHRLLVRERALVRLLPLGQVFDFLKSKDTQPLNMEVPPASACSRPLTMHTIIHTSTFRRPKPSQPSSSPRCLPPASCRGPSAPPPPSSSSSSSQSPPYAPYRTTSSK